MNLKELQQVTVELTTPEGHVYKAGRMSNEERAQKILKLAPAVAAYKGSVTWSLDLTQADCLCNVFQLHFDTDV